MDDWGVPLFSETSTWNLTRHHLNRKPSFNSGSSWKNLFAYRKPSLTCGVVFFLRGGTCGGHLLKGAFLEPKSRSQPATFVKWDAAGGFFRIQQNKREIFLRKIEANNGEEMVKKKLGPHFRRLCGFVEGDCLFILYVSQYILQIGKMKHQIRILSNA